jgi:hypothetical protein
MITRKQAWLLIAAVAGSWLVLLCVYETVKHIAAIISAIR